MSSNVADKKTSEYVFCPTARRVLDACDYSASEREDLAQQKGKAKAREEVQDKSMDGEKDDNDDDDDDDDEEDEGDDEDEEMEEVRKGVFDCLENYLPPYRITSKRSILAS